jgi:hypothetical protein
MKAKWGFGLLTPALLASGLLAVALLLSGCGSTPGDGSAGGQLHAPLTDSQLQALADDAWAGSGLTGDPTVITDTNGGSVGDSSMTAVDGSLDTTSLGNGLNIPMGATGGLTLPHSISALSNGTSVALKSQAAATDATYDIDGTYDCVGGGTVGASGAIVVSTDRTDASSSVHTSAQDLTLHLSACNDGAGHTVWGTIVVNTDNTFTATPAGTNLVDATLDVNEAVAAGLAVSVDPGGNYLLVLRYTRAGTVTAELDSTDSQNPTVLSMGGGLMATFELNNVTCMTVVSFDNSTVTWGCTLNP